MRKKEILAEQYHKKYPYSEFEFSDLGDIEYYLPIAEASMQEYADEFACAFAEWVYKNIRDIGVENGKMIYIYKDYKQYTTTELLKIFKKEQDGK